MVSRSASPGVLGAEDEGQDAEGEKVSVSLARPRGRARAGGQAGESLGCWGVLCGSVVL